MGGRPAEFPIVDYGALKGGAWQPKQISNDKNALGGKPASILYLWAFERPDSLSGHLISHGWVQLGPLLVLVSAEARVEDELLKTKPQVKDRIARFSHDAGTYKSPRFADLEFVASYRGYPINTLWCSDTVWKTAFLEAAKQSRFFVVDVTAPEKPVGLTFELEHLFSSVPASRIILLMDRFRARQDGVISFLSEIWASAGGEQTSDGAVPPPLITYSSIEPRYMARASWSQWTGRPSIPIADRAATFAGWW